MKIFQLFKFVILFTSIIGCSNTRPELGPGSTALKPPQVSDIKPGYNQTPATSRFALGTRLRDELDGNWSRTVGAHGVAAVHRKTGYFQAIPNADSPAKARPPWAKNGEEHNAKALEYLTNLGLPIDQVGEVVSLATMAGSDGNVELAAYTTSLKRRVDSFDVVGSFASVTINIDGDTVAEDIYWPPVVTGAVTAAQHIKSGLAVAAARANFRARLPEGYRSKPEKIAIHHTPSTSATTYSDVATITVDPDDSFALPKHFDLTGAEVRLPWEPRPGAPQPKRVAP